MLIILTFTTNLGLTDDLTSSKNITFFAPTNHAIESLEREMQTLLSNKQEMDQVLRYHCIQEKLNFKDLQDGQTLQSNLKLKSLNDKHQRVRVFRCNDTVALNMFVRIQERDTETTNGVIHVIDRVLIPPMDMLDTLDIAPQLFSTFLLACERVGMDKTVCSQAGLTAFIPTNAAWKNLGFAANAYLFSDEGAKDLKRIVEYHLVNQKLVYAQELIKENKIQLESMLKGQKIELITEEMKKGERELMNLGDSGKAGKGVNPWHYRMLLNRGESRIVFTDVVCENGNAFLINMVMIPDSVELRHGGQERRM